MSGFIESEAEKGSKVEHTDELPRESDAMKQTKPTLAKIESDSEKEDDVECKHIVFAFLDEEKPATDTKNLIIDEVEDDRSFSSESASLSSPGESADESGGKGAPNHHNSGGKKRNRTHHDDFDDNIDDDDFDLIEENLGVKVERKKKLKRVKVLDGSAKIRDPKMEEQRICIKFCVKNQIICSKVVEMLRTAHGDQAVSRNTVYTWYRRFRDGREETEDNPRSGRPSTSVTEENVEKIRDIVLNNRRITIREIADELEISYGSVVTVLTDILCVRRLAAKFVPKILNFQQMSARREMSELNLQAVAEDPRLLQRVITGDESWVDIETNAQSTQLCSQGESRSKKHRQSRSNTKVLLTVFFDYKGIVFHEFLPPGSTVNKEYYREILRRLCENVRSKRPELWANRSWILHHDNAPAHTSLLISDFLTKNSISTFPQPPYSPDLAPCDFFLFPRIKKNLKEQRFETIEEIKRNSEEQLNSIPKDAFKRCFEEWERRWHKCIAAGGSYFEGNKNTLED